MDRNSGRGLTLKLALIATGVVMLPLLLASMLIAIVHVGGMVGWTMIDAESNQSNQSERDSEREREATLTVCDNYETLVGEATDGVLTQSQWVMGMDWLMAQVTGEGEGEVRVNDRVKDSVIELVGYVRAENWEKMGDMGVPMAEACGSVGWKPVRYR